MWTPERKSGCTQFWSSDDRIPSRCRDQLTHLWSQVDKELSRYVHTCIYACFMFFAFIFFYASTVHISHSVATTVIKTEFAGSCRFMVNPRDKSGLLGGVYAPIQTPHILLESMGAVSTLGLQTLPLGDLKRASKRVIQRRRILRPKFCMCVANPLT